MPKRVLYVTYDGLEEPLGQSQVLPYVRGLAARGYQFEVLSFEKPGVPLRYREKLAAGVYWTALRYHKKFSILATLFDLKLGFFVASWLILRRRVNWIHARSYVPALLAFFLSLIYRRAWIFDTRGLWADEKVESGTWAKTSWAYRFFKQAERVFFKHASAVVVLTERFKEYLRDKTSSPVVVIPTCVDLKVFFPSPQGGEGLGVRSNVLIYLGSLGGLYMGEEVLKFYRHWRKYAKNSQLWIISQSAVMSVGADIQNEIQNFAVEHDQVPELLGQAAAGVCFIKPSFSKLASAPTKLGELLACGLPVAANLIGDMGSVLLDTQAGIVLKDFEEVTLEESARKLYEASLRAEVKQEARALAQKWFSLDDGVQKYNEIYQNQCVA